MLLHGVHRERVLHGQLLGIKCPLLLLLLLLRLLHQVNGGQSKYGRMHILVGVLLLLLMERDAVLQRRTLL